MESSLPPRPPARSAAAIGLAFVIGTLVFFIVFQLVRIFGTGGHDPLTPIAERKGGSMSAEILLPARSGPPPSATAPSTSPAVWSLADQRGRVVMVNYFATWCGPCMIETPELVEIANEYAGKGVVTVAVSVDRPEDRVGGEDGRVKALEDYVKNYNVPYAILVPPANSMLWTMDFPIPQTFLYDREGRRVLQIVGAFNGRSLRKSLDELLNEPG